MSLTLNKTNYPLVVGNADKRTFSGWETNGSTVTLTASLDDGQLPSGALSWRSLNPDIARIVSVDGPSCLVQARTTGYTEIVASLPGQTPAVCSITVIDNMTRTTVREIVLNLSELILPLRGSARLIPILYPKDICRELPDAFEPDRLAKTMNDTLLWYSDNETVATVSDGIVTAHAPGTACITAASADIGRSSSCHVCVTEKIGITGIEPRSQTRFSMKTGETFQLDVCALSNTLSPDDTIVYVSENRYTADVDANGLVTAYSASTRQQPGPDALSVSDVPDFVTILASTKEGGFTVRFQIGIHDGSPRTPAVFCPARTVSAALPDLPEKLCLEPAQIIRLSPDFGNNLVWESSDPGIVSVNREGYLCAGQSGTATVTVSCCSTDLTGEDSVAGIPQSPPTGLLLQFQDTLPHSSCLVTVLQASPYLHNLHIPAETVTDCSVILLWNRLALTQTPSLAFYRILQNGVPLAETSRLGFTAKNLSPNTEYTFTVQAISQNSAVLAARTVTAATRLQSAVLNVLQAPWCADGSGRRNDTLAIQRAINECPAGGTVLLPEGHIFYTGALFLKSDMTFQVDGILLGSDDPKDYPLVLSRWEGFRKFPQDAREWANSTPDLPYNTYVRASLLNGGEYDEGLIGAIAPFSLKNLTIRGRGQINGNGFRLAFCEGANQAEHGGGRPVPFSPIKNPTLRGSLIRLHNAQNVLVADLTLAYGPGWQIHPIYCDSVTFDNLDLISKGTGKTGAADDINILNGDGIDPESCSRINIVNCRFFCGDDSVTLKSGRNKEGNELDKPAEYIRVTDCTVDGSKAGFVIGSEIASGAHDVLFQNLTIRNVPLMGLWIKTMRPRGGIIERICYRDITIEDTKQPIWISLSYSPNASTAAAVNPADKPPVIRHITFENVDCENNGCAGIRLEGLEESPIQDIRFLQVSCKKWDLSNALCQDIS